MLCANFGNNSTIAKPASPKRVGQQFNQDVMGEAPSE
jgi:hypothetical protein